MEVTYHLHSWWFGNIFDLNYSALGNLQEAGISYILFSSLVRFSDTILAQLQWRSQSWFLEGVWRHYIHTCTPFSAKIFAFWAKNSIRTNPDSLRGVWRHWMLNVPRAAALKLAVQALHLLSNPDIEPSSHLLGHQVQIYRRSRTHGLRLSGHRSVRKYPQIHLGSVSAINFSPSLEKNFRSQF